MSDGQTRILVVEDDSTDFIFVKKAFEGISANVELYHCPSVNDALPMLESKACRIVFLDLNLDGECGIEVLKSIRRSPEHGAVPVIIFSSSSSERDIAACYRAGANAYLEKPFTIEAYRQFARAFCSFWLETAIIPQD